jgi:hypothetical protein
MAVPYERLVAEDLNTGHGTVSVTMPAGGSATGTKIGLHTFARRYNVEDFGAVSGQYADTAIQAAIDQAAADTAGTEEKATVYLPGQYRIGRGVTIGVDADNLSPRISIVGEGPQSSILLGDAGVTVLTVECGDDGYTDATFERFGIMSGSRGIYVTDAGSANHGMTHCAFRHLRLWNLTDSGLYADVSEILESTFEHIDAEACAYGMKIACPDAFNVITFSNCQFRTCTTRGLYMGDLTGSVNFDNCLWESNLNIACEITDTHYGIQFNGGWFENNGASDGGGPYPNITLRNVNTNASFGLIRLQGVQFIHTGNDGRYTVRVSSNKVGGYLVFDGCGFIHALGSKIDVGTEAVRPTLTIVNQIPGNPWTVEGTAVYADVVSQGNVEMPATGIVKFLTRGWFGMAAAGFWFLEPLAAGVARLCFGTPGPTVPMLRAVGTQLQTVLGDESATCDFKTATLTVDKISTAAAGGFTMAASFTQTIANTAVTASSRIFLFPTNAAGATLMASAKSLYMGVRTAGVSFTVITADGNNAAGTETFNYLIVN